MQAHQTPIKMNHRSGTGMAYHGGHFLGVLNSSLCMFWGEQQGALKTSSFVLSNSKSETLPHQTVAYAFPETSIANASAVPNIVISTKGTKV